MAIGSLKDLYLNELGDLYDAETQMIRALPRLADAARAPELRDVLLKHGEESRLHLERLQLIFTHWGERAAPKTCAGLAGIVQEGDERLNQPATPDAKDAAIIGIAQRIEHYELAAYGCARTYARRLNRPDEARLLQETLDDEGRADRRLTEIAEAHVNDDARGEPVLYQPPARATRLRYIEAARLADSRLATGSLVVRNQADDDLGTFDGLIVDLDDERPRYIVVDARAVFSRRRYLLPVGAARLEPTPPTLRVDLDKDVAERFPAFDADEFQRLDDEGLRAYDTKVRELLAREAGESASTAVDAGVPEWLMTGVWITVPPDRAEQLSDEARAFANEFTPDRQQRGGDAVRQVAADRPTPPHGDKLR